MKLLPNFTLYDDQPEYLADIEHLNDEDIHVESTTLKDALRFKTRKDCHRFIYENGIDHLVSVHAIKDTQAK